MKIYEKPMAKIENINVEDVITSSAIYTGDSAMAKEFGVTDSSSNVIVFEW